MIARAISLFASLLLVVATAAACSSSQSLPCAAPAASACPSLDGVTTFCSWAQWGCAKEAACGGYDTIVDQGVSARLTYYYSATTGQFVATVEEAFSGGNAQCIAGPAQFQVPSGCATSDTLADCNPPPRDAGLALLDAASDAPFNPAPSPSTNPSSQPFARPPPAYPPR